MLEGRAVRSALVLLLLLDSTGYPAETLGGILGLRFKR
jgi:hypothetical protein